MVAKSIQIIIFSLLCALTGCATNSHSLLKNAAPGLPANATAIGVESGETIPVQNLETALLRQQIAIDFSNNSKFSIFQRTIAASRGTLAIAGASADALYLFCIQGMLLPQSAPMAKPGQMVVWLPGETTAYVYHVDMARWQKSIKLPKNSPVAAPLQATVQEQQWDIFWGLLEPTNVNVQVSTLPEVESVRREYLLKPEVVKLRYSHDSSKELAKAIILRFLEALKNKDSQTLAQLLTPGLGDSLAKEQQQADSPNLYGPAVRKILAKALLKRNWTELNNATIEATSSDHQWQIVTDSHVYLLRLHQGDGMLFVESFEPQIQ